MMLRVIRNVKTYGLGLILLCAPSLFAQSPSFDEYVETDAKDGAFTTVKKEFRGKGIPKSYVRKMARPAIPEAALNTVQQFPTPLPKSPGDNTIVGDILVVEANTNLVQNSAQGGANFIHDGQGMFYIVHRVLAELGDLYDVVSVFTTFEDQTVAAYYMPLRNDVSGLGECNYQAGRTFGCEFDNTGGILSGGLKLQGFVFMNSVSTWRNWDANYGGEAKDVSDIEHAVYATLGQEVAHRWGSGLRFVDPRTGSMSNLLLGRDMSHWAAFVDTDASVMDGWNWEPMDGVPDTYEVTEALKRYSTLDLYTMGALPVASAKPFFFIDDAMFRRAGQFLDPRPVQADEVLKMPTPEYLAGFNVVLSATGERVDLTIQDIVDAEGNRCPDPDHTPKTFRQAFVLLTNNNQSLSQVNTFIGELDIVRANWEAWWSDRVDKKITLCTSLQNDCLHAETLIGEASLTELGPKDNVIDIGEDFDVEIPISVTGDSVDQIEVDVAFYGNGAENISYYEADSDLRLKDVAVEQTATAKIAFAVDPAYVCGHSTLINVTVSSEKSPPITETLRIYPGYEVIFEESFESDDGGFVVNDDGADDVSAGAMERAPVYLSCDMTIKTPERDASLGGDTAFITGTTSPLDGSTSLWSPAISLENAVAPEVRFSYWFDGASNDDLRVAVSEDGKSWKKALDITESDHRWVQGRLIVEDIFGTIPDQIFVRFVFTSQSGLLEGGIDEFRVLSLSGECAGGLCSCETTEQSPKWLWLGLGFALCLRLRRRRSL